jgi:uncharacterized protein (DUF2384 family)
MSSRQISHPPTKDAVLNHAREIFGDPRKVYSWMNTPNALFSGMRPADFIAYGSSDDLQKVMDELDRIDQGVF